MAGERQVEAVAAVRPDKRQRGDSARQRGPQRYVLLAVHPVGEVRERLGRRPRPLGRGLLARPECFLAHTIFSLRIRMPAASRSHVPATTPSARSVCLVGLPVGVFGSSGSTRM